MAVTDPSNWFLSPNQIPQQPHFTGWYDVQAKVRGPAVQQIWKVFANRWNDPQVEMLCRLIPKAQWLKSVEVELVLHIDADALDGYQPISAAPRLGSALGHEAQIVVA